MQRLQGDGSEYESRRDVKPLSHAANSVIVLAPVQDIFSSCATVHGDTPAPVKYAVLDTALESPRVEGDEVMISVWSNAHRLHARTLLTLTGAGTSELPTVDQQDMLIDEFDEFAACAGGDGQRRISAAEGTAAPTGVLAALASNASEPAV